MAGRKTKTITSLNDILSVHPSEIQALAERLRTIIQAAVPEANETVNPSWHSLNYHHPEAGYFCGLFPFNDRITLAFEWGALLADPDELFAGGGKQVRYVHVRRAKDIRVRALKRLLRAALDLPRDRSVKVALLREGAKPIRAAAG